MKNFQLKTLAAALAIAGFTSACDHDNARRDAYVTPEAPPIERSTTADGTSMPGAIESEGAVARDGRDGARRDEMRNQQTLSQQEGVDHEETVQFSGNQLTDDSEDKLENLVESLDQDKPVAVIVAMDDDGSRDLPANAANTHSVTTDDTHDLTTQSGTPNDPDPAARRDLAEQQGNVENALDNETVFAQRVARVKAFLQQQGVEVVRWEFEDSEQYPAQQQQNTQEDVQQVRIVIADTTISEEISAL